RRSLQAGNGSPHGAIGPGGLHRSRRLPRHHARPAQRSGGSEIPAVSAIDQDGRRRTPGQEVRTGFLQVLMMRDLPIYILALLLGLGAGVLEIRMEDLLVTALFVMIGTMALGYLRPKSPWRWTLIVGGCVPLVRFWAFAFRREPANRAQL